jgi:hypothetical protein
VKFVLKSGLGAAIVVGGVLINAGLLVGIQLASLEDKSASGALLDPLMIVPYNLITGLCGMAFWFMFHKRQWR